MDIKNNIQMMTSTWKILIQTSMRKKPTAKRATMRKLTTAKGMKTVPNTKKPTRTEPKTASNTRRLMRTEPKTASNTRRPTRTEPKTASNMRKPTRTEPKTASNTKKLTTAKASTAFSFMIPMPQQRNMSPAKNTNRTAPMWIWTKPARTMGMNTKRKRTKRKRTKRTRKMMTTMSLCPGVP